MNRRLDKAIHRGTYNFYPALVVMIISVETHTESEGEELPDAFLLGVRRLTITGITDRWLAQDYSYFKVMTEDKATYILRHDKLKGVWELTLFSASHLYQNM